MGKKVYIAKSMKSDTAIYTAVFNFLSKFDVEIKEHVGPSKNYNPAIVKSCDYIILIPPAGYSDPGECYIGKGLYATLTDFLSVPERLQSTKEPQIPNVLFASLYRGELLFYTHYKLTEVEKDWAIKWAEVSLYESVDPVSFFGLTEKGITNSQQNGANSDPVIEPYDPLLMVSRKE